MCCNTIYTMDVICESDKTRARLFAQSFHFHTFTWAFCCRVHSVAVRCLYYPVLIWSVRHRYSCHLDSSQANCRNDNKFYVYSFIFIVINTQLSLVICFLSAVFRIRFTDSSTVYSIFS